MTQVSDLIKTLKTQYNPDEHIVVAFWDKAWFEELHKIPEDMTQEEFGEFASALEEADCCCINDDICSEVINEFTDEEPDTYGMETKDIIAHGTKGCCRFGN